MQVKKQENDRGAQKLRRKGLIANKPYKGSYMAPPAVGRRVVSGDPRDNKGMEGGILP